MKKSLSAIALAIAFLFNLSVRADDAAAVPASCDICCNDCCCGGWVADFDATFFRYHRANGVGVAVNVAGVTAGFAPAEFDFNFAPRISLGYESCDGLGVRVRYWDYDEAVVGPGVAVGAPVSLTVAAAVAVEATTFDAEVYQEIQLNCCTTLEVSAGVRYADYSESLRVNLAVGGTPVATVLGLNSEFNGYGGLLGAQINRDIGNGTSLYARARGSILMSDRDSTLSTAGVLGATVVLPDVTCGMTEIAFGVQHQFCLGHAIATVRAGAEWQNWYNFTSELPLAATSIVTSPMDVGFGGFVFGGSLQF